MKKRKVVCAGSWKRHQWSAVGNHCLRCGCWRPHNPIELGRGTMQTVTRADYEEAKRKEQKAA